MKTLFFLETLLLKTNNITKNIVTIPQKIIGTLLAFGLIIIPLIASRKG